LEILRIKEKSLQSELSYYQYMEPTSQRTLSLLKEQWALEAKRINAVLEGERKIDERAYVKRKEDEFNLQNRINLLEYEENKKLAILAIDEKRGKRAEEEIILAKIDSYKKLIDIYQKELELRKDDANAQVSINKKIDDANTAIQEQLYLLEQLKGTFSEGLMQGVIDYYRQMKTTFEYGITVVNDFASVAKSSFSSFFKDLKNNQLKSFGEYFTDFCDKLLDKWLDTLSEMLVNTIMTGRAIRSASVGGGALEGGVFGGLLGILGFSVGKGLGGSLTGSGYFTGPGPADFYGVPNTPVTVLHGGGIVGKEGGIIMAPATTFVNAPRFHSGNEYPAILREGEGVFTPEQMRAMSPARGLAQSSPSVVINIENKTNAQVKAREGASRFDGKRWVKSIMLELATVDSDIINMYGVR